jgi:hypothetical protein
MTDKSSDIVVVSSRIEPGVLAQLVGRFEDMVKYVVDIERKVVAVGGELHADAEEVLLESGSHQSDIWGANYYPGRGADECIEFTSLIEDSGIRELIRELTFLLIGEGEPL